MLRSWTWISLRLPKPIPSLPKSCSKRSSLKLKLFMSLLLTYQVTQNQLPCKLLNTQLSSPSTTTPKLELKNYPRLCKPQPSSWVGYLSLSWSWTYSASSPWRGVRGTRWDRGKWSLHLMLNSPRSLLFSHVWYGQLLLWNQCWATKHQKWLTPLKCTVSLSRAISWSLWLQWLAYSNSNMISQWLKIELLKSQTLPADPSSACMT